MTGLSITAPRATDIPALYALGLQTPELKVSATEPFMDDAEFRAAVANPDGVFLVAQKGSDLVGFVYANANDVERSEARQWACIIYIVVAPKWRRAGVAQALYTACTEALARRGVTHVYAWASAESPAILAFMRRMGFAVGHTYVWVDRRIAP